jgi:hypothetical protein
MGKALFQRRSEPSAARATLRPALPIGEQLREELQAAISQLQFSYSEEKLFSLLLVRKAHGINNPDALRRSVVNFRWIEREILAVIELAAAVA